MANDDVCIDVSHLGLTFMMMECPGCKDRLFAETDDDAWLCPNCDPDQFQIENSCADVAAIPSSPLSNKSR